MLLDLVILVYEFYPVNQSSESNCWVTVEEIRHPSLPRMRIKIPPSLFEKAILMRTEFLILGNCYG